MVAASKTIFTIRKLRRKKRLRRWRQVDRPTYTNLNRIIAQTVSSITAPTRV